MKREKTIISSIDLILLGIFLLFCFIGWLNIYSASLYESEKDVLLFSKRYGKQIIWIGASILMAVVIMLLDSKFYSLLAYIIYGITILLLIAVLIFGKEVNGAKSWFEIGSIRLQPAEFAKFSTCLALAKFIEDNGFNYRRLTHLVISFAIIFTPALLIILQNDTGSALVYFVFFLVLYREGLPGIILFIGFLIGLLFVFTLISNLFTITLTSIIIAVLFFIFTTNRRKELIFFFAVFAATFGSILLINEIGSFDIEFWLNMTISFSVAAVPAVIWAIKNLFPSVYVIVSITLASIIFSYSVSYIFNEVLESHQRTRINVLLGIEEDLHGAGYNVNQSKIAIGSGGLLGKGFTGGTQTKLDFVPEQSTDFIFCTVGEEWGFIGSSFVVILFVLFISRIIIVAERQTSSFSRIYGYGLACIIFFHFAVNIGMTIGLAPVIGIPLPFFSYGGSSLWAFTILLFIFIKLNSVQRRNEYLA